MIESKYLKVDRYCNSVVLSHGIFNKNGTQGRKKKSKKTVNGLSCLITEYSEKLNHKNYRTIKKQKQLINLFYEERDKTKNFYWVTITTMQSQTGLTDSDIWYRIKLYLQHRKMDYICTAERQRETTDIHFHIICQHAKNFNISNEVNRLSELFGVFPHPALYDVKKVTNVNKLSKYITKYVSKPCPTWRSLQKSFDESCKLEHVHTKKCKKFKPPYSSLFEGRSFSYSGHLGKLYKEKHSQFCLSVPLRLIEDYKEKFQLLRRTDFFTTYQYTVNIWNLSNIYKSEHLVNNYMFKTNVLT
jgi:hypothetical protein